MLNPPTSSLKSTSLPVKEASRLQAACCWGIHVVACWIQQELICNKTNVIYKTIIELKSGSGTGRPGVIAVSPGLAVLEMNDFAEAVGLASGDQIGFIIC